MLKQLIIASLAITSVAATSAQAQETRSVKVSVAGIDTRSESGAHILLQRINVAAGTICSPTPSNALQRHEQFEPCVRKVTQRTVAKLNYPMLSALANTGDGGAQLASAK